ncbi:putative disease resistance RPP13-like protein 1 [Quercus lobata]|uniref:putative disease resistance RPP13-like protein 1 n=1 Tax=Quercus lobata TaxID=97700 RepID=UPI00124628E9|nr:putative disease resistance RPP13-like protein 1 [Quercus lobata]
MAEALVGGVLSAFLKVAFDRLASREVLDFLKGRKPIDGLVQKLKIELMSADAVLVDAEEKQFTNPAVEERLDELKDAVYVADDLLDEIAYEALRCKLEAESQNNTSYGSIEKGWSSFIQHHPWNCFQSHQRFVEVLKSKSTHLYGSKLIVIFLGIILLGNYVP